MDNSYLWLKTIHLLGVVLFLGNIIVTAWWKNMADRTRNPKIIAFAQRQVTITDYIFTGGGALILFVAGIYNANVHHLFLGSKWLANALTLFTISGLIWVAILIPVQMKQAKMAKVFSVTEIIPDAYWKLCAVWNIFGITATLLPMANIYFMVFKPIS